MFAPHIKQILLMANYTYKIWHIYLQLSWDCRRIYTSENVKTFK